MELSQQQKVERAQSMRALSPDERDARISAGVAAGVVIDARRRFVRVKTEKELWCD